VHTQQLAQRPLLLLRADVRCEGAQQKRVQAQRAEALADQRDAAEAAAEVAGGDW
jgi:hypothetical protein